MADKRKLQSDIDRTLKRVQEGRTAFQDTLEKFESSTNQTQKEKFEGDLKKEIKKLQRLRDQIKTWLTANEVKDKRPLLEARKVIEQDMERFKVIEKETKTKAYSKEGLLSTDAKKDPLQKEKEELDDWLKQCISSLNTQNEKYEFEIESLTNNNKKKRLDKDTVQSIEEKRQRLENCSFHVKQLETIMRLLDNERLDCAILRSIKDPIEFVIQNCDEPSALDYRDMYDDLRLDEIGDSSGINPGTAAPANPSEQDINGIITPAVINHRVSNDDAGSSASTHTSISTHTDSSTTHPTSSASSNASSSRERTKSEDKVSTVLNHVSASSTSTPLKPTQSSVIGSGFSGKNKASNVANQTAPPALMSQVVAGTPNKSNRSFQAHNTNGSILLGLVSPSESVGNKSSIDSHLSTPDTSIRTPKSDAVAVVKPSERNATAPTTIPYVISDSHGKSVSSSEPNDNESSVSSAVLATSPTLTPTCGIALTTNSTSIVALNAVMGNQGISAGLLASSDILPPTLATQTSAIIPSGPIEIHNEATIPHPTQVATTNPTSVQDNNLSSLLLMNSVQTPAPAETDNPMITTCLNMDTSFASSLANKLHSSVPVTTASQAFPLATAGGVMPQSAAPIHHSTSHLPLDKQLPSLPTSMHTAQPQPRAPICVQMHPRDAAAPFRNRTLDNSKAHIPQELYLQLQALENGFRRLPHPCDTEKSRMIVCKNLVNGPSYYPREPLPGTDTEEYYMKLDAQTLFFIFYYFEGTKAQYFAAKALKRMSWRFHTKYMMWFQRHEEPKQITDEFESGSYIYYDYKTMSQRKKEEFVFQYSFLEDKDF